MIVVGVLKTNRLPESPATSTQTDSSSCCLAPAIGPLTVAWTPTGHLVGAAGADGSFCQGWQAFRRSGGQPRADGRAERCRQAQATVSFVLPPIIPDSSVLVIDLLEYPSL